VSYKPGFGIGEPRQLFKVKSRYEGAGRAWDVDPSGKRFLLIRPIESAADRGQPPRTAGTRRGRGSTSCSTGPKN
jgi:hypothetical protein